MSRDFATSDGIRDELRQRGGVIIDDRQRTWTAADGRSGRRPSAHDTPGMGGGGPPGGGGYGGGEGGGGYGGGGRY